MDLSTAERRYYSQNGEDGITLALVTLLYDDLTSKYYVEFGVESGEECNTRILRESLSWQGLLMDGSHSNQEIGLYKEFVTKENILDLFKKYSVPKHIQYLSVDIDYNDFYLVKQILSSYTCDIVVCEYNAEHLPSEDKVVIYNPTACWDKTNYFGASLLAFKKLLASYNYTLVYCEKMGINCFFIRTELLQEKNLEFLNIGDLYKLYRAPMYTSNGRDTPGHYADPQKRQYISSTEAMLI